MTVAYRNDVCGRCLLQVRLYRNGDGFFAGMNYPVSAERHRTLDALLEDLTHSVICDRTVLPQGVRYLFAADTGRRVTTLEQLEDGANYVCSTKPQYRRLDYTRIGSVHPSGSHHQVDLYASNYTWTYRHIIFTNRRCIQNIRISNRVIIDDL